MLYDWGNDMKDEFILQKKTDIGLIREKNEDSGVVLTHPQDDKVKLLAIADGMGGKDLGDVASNYVITQISKWFQKASIELLEDSFKTSLELKELINKSNNSLISKYGEK